MGFRLGFEPPLDPVQVRLDPIGRAVPHQSTPAYPIASTGLDPDHFVWQRFKPLAEGRLLSRSLVSRHRQLDEVGGSREVPAAMAWRIASARSPFSSNHSVARRCSSSTNSGCSSRDGLEDIREQMVVAIPVPPVVQGNEQ